MGTHLSAPPQALWMLDPKDIGEWQHEEFYRFIAQAYDKPRYVLHYKTDAPLNIRSIFYVPEQVRAVLSREQRDICPVPLRRRERDCSLGRIARRSIQRGISAVGWVLQGNGGGTGP